VATGKETDVSANNEAIVSFRATPDASRFALLISTPTKIGDLYWLDKASGTRKQLTHVNEELFSKLNLSEPEEIWYTSFDGKKVQTWVQKPPDFDPAKKYPLILNIHGGPHAAYGWVFDHEFQFMAAKGYVVLYPNPRGSTTYGQDFGNIIQYHYPGDDYKDLMAGVDAILKRGYIDSTRLGVTGGSGGGVLTNWIVGHTNRFAAAESFPSMFASRIARRSASSRSRLSGTTQPSTSASRPAAMSALAAPARPLDFKVPRSFAANWPGAAASRTEAPNLAAFSRSARAARTSS